MCSLDTDQLYFLLNISPPTAPIPKLYRYNVMKGIAD